MGNRYPAKLLETQPNLVYPAVSICASTADDLPAAAELGWREEWNQTIRDWQRLLEFEPQGCAAESDGSLVGTVTSITYGRELGAHCHLRAFPSPAGFLPCSLIWALSSTCHIPPEQEGTR